MSTNPTFHSAEGQMLGYLYQIERALFWLSVCEKDGIVSIEMEDDVVVKLQNGESIETIFEQDKSTLKASNPYGNKSKNLWKTLIIWLDLLTIHSYDISSSRFILATTKPVSKVCLARKMSNCNDEKEAQAILQSLKKIAKEKPSKSIRSYCNKFLNYSDDLLLELILRVSLVDNDYKNDRQDLKDKIKYNLKISDEVPFSNIYIDLIGGLFDKTISYWINGENAIFNVNSIWTRKDQLIQKYSQKRFIEKTKENLPIQKIAVEQERGKNFVKQLEIIDLDEKEIIESINDYLRSKMERSTYAEQGRVTMKEFRDFENDLTERWQQIYRTKCRLSKELNDSNKGYDIFSETIQHKGILAGIQTEQYYTTKGTYHQLSNQKILGWHPNWKEQV